MSDFRSGGPAFPQMDPDSLHFNATGMTLRDWFAGKALAGIMASPTWGNVRAEDIVAAAYAIADAMIAKRDEK